MQIVFFSLISLLLGGARGTEKEEAAPIVDKIVFLNILFNELRNLNL